MYRNKEADNAKTWERSAAMWEWRKEQQHAQEHAISAANISVNPSRPQPSDSEVPSMVKSVPNAHWCAPRMLIGSYSETASVGLPMPQDPLSAVDISAPPSSPKPSDCEAHSVSLHAGLTNLP